MPGSKELRRRIKSIKSTRQITKAMELVAATKMRRAQAQAIKSRTYAELAWEMINNLSDKIHPASHALLRQPGVLRSIMIVLITSNRGLAGSFNNQLITKTIGYIRRLRADYREISVNVIVLGKKGAEAMVKDRQQVIANFQKADVNLEIADVLPLSAHVLRSFALGTVDRVELAYTDFISTLRQQARIKQLLPFPRLQAVHQQATADERGKAALDDRPSAHLPEELEFLFEPAADAVLEKLLPRLVEMQLYQAMLESNASEHSARMVAMKNASDAAHDLISDLTLQFNQLRQAAITQEIAEISAGRLAVA